MKRIGWFFLAALLVAAALLALKCDLADRIFDHFRGGVGEAGRVQIDLLEEYPSSGDSALEDDTALPPPADLKSLACRITAEASSDYEKLCAIYDWVTANIAYDVEKAANMEAYGSGARYVLEKRKGVCHDYAELTRELLKAAGIKATYEKGDVHPAPGRTERHAWNQACIGETCYGLDTTWGSGFVDESKGIFVPRASRLYLTSPEELGRLHNDPSYKESCEKEMQRLEAAAASPASLPEYEARLLVLMNETRAAAGLEPLSEEARLLAAVRQSAAAAAGKACSGEEHSLEQLKAELERRAPEIRLEKAGMYAFTLWDYPLPTADELYRLIIAEESGYLHDAGFQAVSLGVIRRGPLVIATQVFISYY